MVRQGPEMPTDELTGLPLPILPQAVLPVDNPLEADWHHQWHPSPAPASRTLGDRALRNSRLQLVSQSDHVAYHRLLLRPQWPETTQAQFDMTVLGVAGYIPPEAIDVQRDGPERILMQPGEVAILRTIAQQRPITSEQMAGLRAKIAKTYAEQAQPGVTEQDYVERSVAAHVRKELSQAEFSFHHIKYEYSPVRTFFQEFVLAQDIGHIREVQVEEFVLTNDAERANRIGHELLALNIRSMTDSVKPVYDQAMRAGRLHPKSPLEAYWLVHNKLGAAAAHDELIGKLKAKLIDEAGL